jgi:hypothetical protein
MLYRLNGRAHETIDVRPLPCRTLLGCDGAELVKHLERQFQDGWTWGNYAVVWELDHVVPIRAAGAYGPPTTLEKFERLHWTNVQPLSIAAHAAKTIVDVRDMRIAGLCRSTRPAAPKVADEDVYEALGL